MIVHCDKCHTNFDDLDHWTSCPHEYFPPGPNYDGVVNMAGDTVALIPQSDTTGTAFAGGRLVTTDDLAEVKLFVLWFGNIHVEHHFGKYHGVFLTKQDAMAACPGEGRLWEPSRQFPFDAWLLVGTMWYVRRYNPGFLP